MPRQTAGKGKQIQQKGIRRIVPDDFPAALDPGVEVDVFGLHPTVSGKQQQVPLGHSHGVDGHFELGPVDQMARLKPDDALPAELFVIDL